MPRPDFGNFEAKLRHDGVAEKHVLRANTELRDHFDDLVDEALASGLDLPAAEQSACDALGDLQLIADDIASRPELRSWAFRHPRLALVAYPCLCIALVPALPVFAGVAHASTLARWATCLLLGGFVTAAMLLFMQLSITLT